ncbi:MAG: helix-turn-helix domain-containing protein, partial [Lachnospiraceae bacterium]|nr:helix-turn-helix domain-containing protein [Lachnospiraceae bacterium]
MNRVQEIRKERCLTQDKLASEVGISRKYLSNVERQLAVPSVELAFRISNALAVDIDKVFFDVSNVVTSEYPKPMKFIDLFCGIGGFRYASGRAFKNLGIEG